MEWLLEWNHFIYLVPLLAAILMVIGALLGVADLDGHGDWGHDSHDFSDHDVSDDSGVKLLGLGKVPVMMLLLVVFLTFGISGLMSEALFNGLPLHEWMSLVMAGLTTFLATPIVVRLIAKWMPTTETYSVRNTDLLGLSATSMFDAENNTTYAQLKDHEGNLQQVTVSVQGRIRKGETLLLTNYNTENGVFSGEPVSPSQE